MGILSWLKGRRSVELDEDDFKEEIRAHLAIATQEKIADGADRTEAHYAALKEFGNVTRTTEAARSVWTPRWLEALRDLMSDVRYAIRALAKNPAFSFTVVGVLTLGIGLNAAVFTMLKGMALSPLAGVAKSGSLAVIFAETSAGRPLRVSYPDYQYLRDHDRAFSELFGSIVATANLGRGRGARQVWGEIVTGNYFKVLGVRAGLGRTLLPSDEIAPGRHPVVVISDGLWRRDFHADPGIVGKTLEINNNILTVVGVADPAFHGTIVSYDVELFIPVMMAPQLGFTFGSQQTTPSGILSDRRAGVFYPHGYLRPGITLANATAQADAVWATLSRERPLTDAAQRLKVVRFWQTPGSGPTFMLPTLTVLEPDGSAGPDRSRARTSRGSCWFADCRGAAKSRCVWRSARRGHGSSGCWLSKTSSSPCPAPCSGSCSRGTRSPSSSPTPSVSPHPQRIFFNIEVDGLVIGFTALVACGSALVFGFVPALQSSRVDLVSVINEDASPRGAARGRLRAGLVVAQVAVSLLLLVGAGLATRSVDAARRANPGFDASQVTAIELDVKQNAYDEARGRVFYRKLLDASRADPGIESATLAAYVPMGLLDTRVQRVSIEGYEPRQGEDLAFMSNAVGSDYFRTLRITVTAGREFEDRDDETGAPVAVVNATLAQRFWGSASNAIGKQIRVGDRAWRTVVGVAADVKYSRINEAPRPYFYVPFLQVYRSAMILHTRGAAPVDRLVDQARASVAALDGDSADPGREADGRHGAGRADFLQPDRDHAVRLRRRRHGAGGDGHLRAGVVHRQTEHA